jgi:hypothetical protein
MLDSQNDNLNSQPGLTNVKQEMNIYEDEINLIDYFRIVWKRKYFIVLGSALPALVVVLIFFFSPRSYKVTYVYDVKDQSIYDVEDQTISRVTGWSISGVSNWNLNEKNYKVLIDKFYSSESMDKIISKLRENGLDRYAESTSSAKGDLKKSVEFEASPPLMDLSKARVIDPVQIEQMRQLKAQLFNMTIVGRSKNDLLIIASVVRDNLENIVPTYMVEEPLKATVRHCRGKLADIEEGKFDRDLALKTDKTILAKLKDIKTETLDRKEGNIVLQFDISGKTEYLPIEYQIQALELRIAQLEGEITSDEEKYNYYRDLLALNEKLVIELENNSSSYYTIQQYRSFLIHSIDNHKDKDELRGYLSSLIKRIENRMAVSKPIMERPDIHPVAKGTVNKSGIVFALSLMISIFAAFLLEGIRKSQDRVS